jgi:hypothetical protein
MDKANPTTTSRDILFCIFASFEELETEKEI